MALTIAQLEAKRDAIISEMALPREQHWKERGVTRRSQSELEAALSLINSQIASGSAGSGARRIRRRIVTGVKD